MRPLRLLSMLALAGFCARGASAETLDDLLEETKNSRALEERANAASYPPGNPKLSVFRDIGALAADVDKMFTDLKAKSGS